MNNLQPINLQSVTESIKLTKYIQTLLAHFQSFHLEVNDVFIMYVYDYDVIISEDNNRIEKVITENFQELYETIKQCWFKPVFHILENEAAEELKKWRPSWE